MISICIFTAGIPTRFNNKKIMKTLRFTLALLLTIYSIPVLLSGLDIIKGTEPDLSSEWMIVTIFFILSLGFFIFNMVEITRKKR